MIRKIKQSLKSRTVWLSIAVVLLSAANSYFEIALSPEAYSAAGVIIGALIAYLRTITDKPIEKL